MNIKKIKKNVLVLLIWNEVRRIRGNILYKKVSDEEFVKELYFKAFNKELNLINPKAFNEKLNWLKINYCNEDAVKCADKFEVRKYLENKNMKWLLNELIDVYESVDEININKLPKRFVLKATHGSGWNLIVKDKDKVNWFLWKIIMKSWLKQNFYYYGREKIYENIKPRIICEKYLEDKNGELLDYKLYCFNGKVKFIQVDVDRFTNHTANYYDREWKLMDIKYADEFSGRNINKPYNFEKMLEVSEELSKEFPHVRVDFYEVDKKLYFGELTFFTASGTGKLEPEEYEYEIGSWLKLT